MLENDGTAAAAGEHLYGAGAGTRNLVYLTISTGVGGGVVVDNRLFRGPFGNGSELGHITIDWHGERELPVPTPDGTPKAQNRVVTIGL